MQLDTDYLENIKVTKDKLNRISSCMCLAKWLQVSLHLPHGKTHSCYHPPAHLVPLNELKNNPGALHNTKHKQKQRQQMLKGNRPQECEYCWKIEDAINGPHYSDRHYRSSEWWADEGWNEIKNIETITPRYVEVNFNQACNFKCTYCSPHLSTTWEDEIKEFGPYKLFDINHNDSNYLDMPLKCSNEENPYVKAFWKWWPDLYKNLKVFRMTGGEPLIDANTYKILNYVIENPNSELELSITSNFCPPNKKILNNFIDKLKKIEEPRWWIDPDKVNKEYNNHNFVGPSCKHFSLFISLDSVGKQAEYIRSGLNYNQLLDNIIKFLTETHGTEICIINTFNLLSIPKFKNFLQLILDLRIQFGYKYQTTLKVQPPDRDGFVHPPFVRGRKQRIWFDIPILDSPIWMNVRIINGDKNILNILEDCLSFMEDNIQKKDYSRTYHGFKQYEIEKLKRNISLIKSEYLGTKNVFRNFYMYFSEIDRRRKTDFIKTFPELKTIYEETRRITTGV